MTDYYICPSRRPSCNDCPHFKPHKKVISGNKENHCDYDKTRCPACVKMTKKELEEFAVESV